MFCHNCGSEIDNRAVICPRCGVPQNNDTGASGSGDNGGFLWGLLGCCIPIVGLILFLVWKDTKPKTAKAAGIGALISVGISILYYIIIAALGLSFFALLNP